MRNRRLSVWVPVVMVSGDDVTFKSYRAAELLDYLPSVERTTAHSIRYNGEDMVEMSKFLEFILSYRSDLEPSAEGRACRGESPAVPINMACHLHRGDTIGPAFHRATQIRWGDSNV